MSDEEINYYLAVYSGKFDLPEIVRLSRSDTTSRRLVAGYPELPVAEIRRLSHDRDIEVLAGVASNENAPADVLDQLAGHPELVVRIKVANNENASTETLDRLVRDDYLNVRIGAIAHPNVSEFSLESLVEDKDIQIRMAVARKTKSATVLARLGYDISHDVRQQVAQNPNTPAYVLKELVSDVPLMVHVAKNPSTDDRTILQFIAYRIPEVLIAISFREDLTTELVEKLMEASGINSRVQITEGLAGNRKAPPEVLASLSQGYSIGTTMNVAANPATPLETLVALANEDSYWVRTHVSVNSSLTDLKTLEALAGDSNHRVRAGIAGNPNAPLYIIRILVRDPSWDVRNYAVIAILEKCSQ